MSDDINIEDRYDVCEVCQILLHVNEMQHVYTRLGNRIWICKDCILNGDFDTIVRILQNEQ